MIAALGEEYVAALRSIYADRVRGGADFVMMWFAKAHQAITSGKVERVGLVATQSIRRGASEAVLRAIFDTGRIFEAWSDEEWSVDGADVRVCLVCFEGDRGGGAVLNGEHVDQIYSDLSAGQANLTDARRLSSNLGVCFQGPVKVGPFEVEGEVAREWLSAPINPNGRPNSDVLRPWANASDIVRRPSGKWIIDFGMLQEVGASAYEKPFEYVRKNVMPSRLANRDEQRRMNWWRLGRSGSDLKAATGKLARQILSPRVSKHRIFTWAPPQLLPDSRLVSIARDDDTCFGVLHSRFHEIWSVRLGGWHGVGNDPQYTPSLGFETFPFPNGLTPAVDPADYAEDPRAVAIASAAQRLHELRENWLNPSDLVRREPEVVPGYPDRILPMSDEAAQKLKKRTLTNLYNERPTWLRHAHVALDDAVSAAYGCPRPPQGDAWQVRHPQRGRSDPLGDHYGSDEWSAGAG